MKKWLLLLLFPSQLFSQTSPGAWIRVNLLGYRPMDNKVAVYCLKDAPLANKWQLVEVKDKKVVLTGNAGAPFGPYGPFNQTYRLNFSSFRKPGSYYLEVGNVQSPVFTINENIYKGTADFCLEYMRQQRSGFNPFLKDSCHTHDGYTMYAHSAGLADSTHINVVGGWHDASDYLQYSSTSANATWHLLAAYRDFPAAFADRHLANGLEGNNGLADVADEGIWGLQWLMKMFPAKDRMFNQLGDDRDHMGMRIPKEDSFYGKGFERPVYFLNGLPQQRGKFMNQTTGVSSTAGKFSAAFALAHILLQKDKSFFNHSPVKSFFQIAFDAYQFGTTKPGVAQTVSVRSPYIYAEENWTDDMELAAAELHKLILTIPGSGDPKLFDGLSYEYGLKEKLTPWLGADTAKHYQWYPFINIGHYELAKLLTGARKDSVISWYREGIEKVYRKAKLNGFFRGIPFIWCSNNLTVAFAIQCYWYRSLTNDNRYLELEQSCLDWIFGCNPWGTSMVYGLPANADTPTDPHSAFTHLKNYPVNGGLVDGPVYGSIYNNLIGITLYQPDEYSEFQSGLAVYHDDYGDYSTNEPTMDGTASLIYLLAAKTSRR